MCSPFFFNDTAPTEIYTLSLHDALPISDRTSSRGRRLAGRSIRSPGTWWKGPEDRKSTRLNSSHGYISYAVFCLKKKKIQRHYTYLRFNALSQDRAPTSFGRSAHATPER